MRLQGLLQHMVQQEEEHYYKQLAASTGVDMLELGRQFEAAKRHSITRWACCTLACCNLACCSAVQHTHAENSHWRGPVAVLACTQATCSVYPTAARCLTSCRPHPAATDKPPLDIAANMLTAPLEEVADLAALQWRAAYIPYINM